ncbi:ribosomal RNA small subunit methyltransferase A, partial [bacterium]|nr:ribosomal RNA small subunit methyltransferase A [bacterium]
MKNRAPRTDRNQPRAAFKPQMSGISRQLAEAGLHLKKGLGQNFLVSQKVLEKIAASVEATPETTVLEIGAGLGNLTTLLAAKARTVFSVELDERFQPLHQRSFRGIDNVLFFYADFMDLDLEGLVAARPEIDDLRVIGNIPYHLTSPILFKLLASAVEPSCICLLVQLEVAVRMAASPGSRHYGILTAKVRARYEVENLFTVAAGSFMPPPKVRSALVRLTPRKGGPLTTDIEERRGFFRFIDAAFAQRRKVLGKSVAAGSRGRIEREDLDGALTELGIDTNI